MKGRPSPAHRCRLGPGLVALAVLAALDLGAVGCLHVAHGVVAELVVGALPTGALERVWLHDGTPLDVEAGSVVVTEARLLPCRGAAARLEEAGRALLGPARARAQHVHDSPFTIAGPFRVSLVAPATVLGAFTPAPGSYCGVHLELGPAASEDGGEPSSLELRARAEDGTPILARTANPGAVHLELDAPLALDRRGTSRLVASLYEARTFARLPALVEGVEPLGAAILRGAAAQGALHVEVPADTGAD